MRLASSLLTLVAILFYLPNIYAAGMVPQAPVVIIDEVDGEGTIDIKNTDDDVALLLTTLHDIPEDNEPLLVISPPMARVSPGKLQRIRFIMTRQEPLETERLKRVTFEGLPAQLKNQNTFQINFIQNLPVIIRPAGLEPDPTAWKHLIWEISENTLTVKNPSKYVVRLDQNVRTLPGSIVMKLPKSYILPGEILHLNTGGGELITRANQIQISPATTWGFTVDTYNAQIVKHGCTDC